MKYIINSFVVFFSEKYRKSQHNLQFYPNRDWNLMNCLKVIFLDVDGVLHPLGKNYLPKISLDLLANRTDNDMNHQEICSSKECGISCGYLSPLLEGEFTSECMEQLSRILKETGIFLFFSRL